MQIAGHNILSDFLCSSSEEQIFFRHSVNDLNRCVNALDAACDRIISDYPFNISDRNQRLRIVQRMADNHVMKILRKSIIFVSLQKLKQEYFHCK